MAVATGGGLIYAPDVHLASGLRRRLPTLAVELVASKIEVMIALRNIDSGSASFSLDVEGPDDVAPLLRFVGDELAKFSGRHRHWLAAELRETRF